MHAEVVRPLVRALLGDDPPVRISLWDGSELGAVDGPGTIHLRSPDALRRMLWSPGELGIARAYVTGDIDVTGDLCAMLAVLRPAGRGLGVLEGLKTTPKALAAAHRLGGLGRPLPPPPIEATARGRRHSLRRDRRAVSHHYDVGNDFYALVLGPSMTYSCAYYAAPDLDLTSAQAAKSELICRKLGLHERPGQRLLDVGCGWGSLAIHAARRHGARVVGITISEQQALLARRRVEAEGLAGQVEIRVQDYREVRGERFDAVSSVGMFEHVGAARTAEYFAVIRGLLGSEGRFLNHAISSVGSTRLSPRSFVGRYVFPDGELLDVGEVVLAMERAGFEVRDVENLREHYARTLRAWVANLEAGWQLAVEQVGEQRARVWRLYMTASILGFEDGGNGLHQVLGVVPDPSGRSGMPPTRDGLKVPESAYRRPSWSSTSSTGATSPVTKVPNSA